MSFSFPESHAARVRPYWGLDPNITFLNHGSFGACPKPVLDVQTALRLQLERQPVRFFAREMDALWGDTLEALARFFGANADDLALVSNATAGVNTVLRSLTFEPGDELLTTDHAYNACRNALDFVAAKAGARVVVADIPFPIESPDEVVAAWMARVTDRTRLALIDHVTSPTGIVLPVEAIVATLADRGIDALVDGAHAPGMISLNLDALGAAYYTGNCHKWMCAPKGAAFLHVRRDKQARLRPLCISHGANCLRTDRSRFRLEFDWTGTMDPTPWLAIPEALRFMSSLLPGGMAAVASHNRQMALAARRLLAAALGSALPAPDSMIGSLATVPVPDAIEQAPVGLLQFDSLQENLFHRHRIEVPIIPFPRWPRRLVRISAQIYNDPQDYRKLANALVDELRGPS